MAASLLGTGRTTCREPTVSTLKAVGAQPGLLCPKMICDGAMCWCMLEGVCHAQS